MRGHVARNLVGDLAAVEEFGPSLPDATKSLGQDGLSPDLTFVRRGSIGIQKQSAGGRAVTEVVQVAEEHSMAKWADAESLVRVFHCGLEDLLPAHIAASIPPPRMVQHADSGWDGCCAVTDKILTGRIGRRRAWGERRSVDGHRTGVRREQDHLDLAAQTGHCRFGDTQRERNRNSGVHGIASGLEYPDARISGLGRR